MVNVCNCSPMQCDDAMRRALYTKAKNYAYSRWTGRKQRAEAAYRMNRISWPEFVLRRRDSDAQYHREKMALRGQYEIVNVPKSY